jgi:aminoglycoside phosphotransferase (APT) family kinase protein
VPLPGYRAGGPLTVAWLGAGESYAAWLVEAGDPVVVRIPYRDAAAMPRPMEAEFAALELVPPEVGTHGLAVGLDAGNPLGCRFVMTTYAPGAPKPVEDWTMADVAAVADRLAALHDRRRPRRGLVTDPQPGPLDIVADFEAGWAWWEGRHPEVTQLPRVQRALPAARRFLTARAAEFAGLGQFSLIHSDLIANNVIFDGGQARFIDWEWAEYGDPARDLALLGGTVHGGPWYVPLAAGQVEALVAAYVAGVEAATGRRLSCEGVLRRRDAWEVHERFLGGLHYLLKAGELPESHYVAGAAEVWSALEARLADAPKLTPCERSGVGGPAAGRLGEARPV